MWGGGGSWNNALMGDLADNGKLDMSPGWNLGLMSSSPSQAVMMGSMVGNRGGGNSMLMPMMMMSSMEEDRERQRREAERRENARIRREQERRLAEERRRAREREEALKREQERLRLKLIRDTLAEANDLLSEGKQIRAISKFNSVLEENPEHFEANQSLATLYYDAGKYGSAIPHLETVLRLNKPTPRDFRFKLGDCYEKVGQIQDAIKTFLPYATRSPKNYQGIARLVALYARQSEADRVIKYYQLLPDDYRTDELAISFNIAVARIREIFNSHIDEQRFKEAFDLYNENLSKFADDHDRENIAFVRSEIFRSLQNKFDLIGSDSSAGYFSRQERNKQVQTIIKEALNYRFASKLVRDMKAYLKEHAPEGDLRIPFASFERVMNSVFERYENVGCCGFFSGKSAEAAKIREAYQRTQALYKTMSSQGDLANPVDLLLHKGDRHVSLLEALQYQAWGENGSKAPSYCNMVRYFNELDPAGNLGSFIVSSLNNSQKELRRAADVRL